jgi:hypothetical protein
MQSPAHAPAATQAGLSVGDAGCMLTLSTSKHETSMELLCGDTKGGAPAAGAAGRHARLAAAAW